jgi:hypothetical protein
MVGLLVPVVVVLFGLRLRPSLLLFFLVYFILLLLVLHQLLHLLGQCPRL